MDFRYISSFHNSFLNYTPNPCQGQVMQVDKTYRLKNKSEELENEQDLITVYSGNTSRTKVTDEEAIHLRSLAKIRDALLKFDLSRNEVKVYLYLARFGAMKAQRIAEALNVHRTEAYKILRRLEKQGLVSCQFERPMKFVSVPFDNAIGNLIEERRQHVHQMVQWKKELMKTWRSLPKTEAKKIRKETFQVLEGRKQVSVKATQILEKCQHEVRMTLSDENLLWLYNSTFFDDLEKLIDEKGISIKILTNLSPTSTYVLEEVNVGEGDFAYMDLEDSPCFIVVDDKEMLLLMEKDNKENNKVFAIWTNYMTLLKSYRLLFNLVWKEPQNIALMAGAPPIH